VIDQLQERGQYNKQELHGFFEFIANFNSEKIPANLIMQYGKSVLSWDNGHTKQLIKRCQKLYLITEEIKNDSLEYITITPILYNVLQFHKEQSVTSLEKIMYFFNQHVAYDQFEEISIVLWRSIYSQVEDILNRASSKHLESSQDYVKLAINLAGCYIFEFTNYSKATAILPNINNINRSVLDIFDEPVHHDDDEVKVESCFTQPQSVSSKQKIDHTIYQARYWLYVLFLLCGRKKQEKNIIVRCIEDTTRLFADTGGSQAEKVLYDLTLKNLQNFYGMCWGENESALRISKMALQQLKMLRAPTFNEATNFGHGRMFLKVMLTKMKTGEDRGDNEQEKNDLV